MTIEGKKIKINIAVVIDPHEEQYPGLATISNALAVERQNHQEDPEAIFLLLAGLDGNDIDVTFEAVDA